jgi:hypothetical protein
MQPAAMRISLNRGRRQEACRNGSRNHKGLQPKHRDHTVISIALVDLGIACNGIDTNTRFVG